MFASRCGPRSCSLQKAFDTPLSPPDFSDEPGPATRRSGAYRDGTHTRWPDTTFRTQQVYTLSRPRPAEWASWSVRGGFSDHFPITITVTEVD